MSNTVKNMNFLSSLVESRFLICLRVTSININKPIPAGAIDRDKGGLE